MDSRRGNVACWVLTFTILGCLAALSAGCGKNDAIRKVKVLDLVKELPRATIQTPETEYVRIIEKQLAGEKRIGFLEHPTSSVEFPEIEATTDSVFTSGIAIQSESWDKSGDGVVFFVSVRIPGQATATQFSRYIDPKKNPDERHWIDIRVPLGAFAGRRIRLILSTGPGPDANSENDWAIWSEPMILLSAE
jgi:hypothetical protein